MIALMTILITAQFFAVKSILITVGHQYIYEVYGFHNNNSISLNDFFNSDSQKTPNNTHKGESIQDEMDNNETLSEDEKEMEEEIEEIAPYISDSYSYYGSAFENSTHRFYFNFRKNKVDHPDFVIEFEFGTMSEMEALNAMTQMITIAMIAIFSAATIMFLTVSAFYLCCVKRVIKLQKCREDYSTVSNQSYK
jgi:hypothetical protein